MPGELFFVRVYCWLVSMRKLGRTLPLLLLTVPILLCSLFIVAQHGPKKKFVPPSAESRKAAVGEIAGLRKDLQIAFDAESTAFKPIPEPGDHDWLANHSEPGQTFLSFLKHQRNRPDKTRKTLYIVPLGEFAEGEEETLIEPLREYSELYFSMPCKLLPVQRDAEDLGITTRINRNTNKSQWLSTDILKALPRMVPEDAFCLLAITKEDLYPEESWNFVFGQASLLNRVGVFSFARYDPAFFGRAEGKDNKLVLKRSCSVLAHETGHMFGIFHCVYFHCIMNGSNNLPESDAAPMHLGPVCLRKLESSIGFDPLTRYEGLAKFYTKHGFDEEKQWVVERVRQMRQPN